MRVISARELRELVSMADAIGAAREGLAALSAGRAVVPVRTAVALPGSDAVLLAMPGALASAGPGAGPAGAGAAASGSAAHAGGVATIGAKLVSVFPGNPAAGLPLIHAAVLLFDGATGRPDALLEGASLTALRTGAGSGLATDLLALPDARIVALFGAGTQARTQLEAICAVRPVTQVRIVDREPARAEALAAWARAQPWSRGATMLATGDPELAVRGAEIVVTATTSPTPVFPGRAVGAGAHINAIGAFQPETREVDSDLVGRAAVFVDTRAGALAEAGDLIIPIAEGVFSAEGIRGELGEVVLGRAGRRGAAEVTLYKSVGTAALDLAVGALAARRAEATGVGVEIDWGGG